MTPRRLPRIGLTTYREQAQFGVWDETADLLPTTYADAIVAAAGVPVLLPPAAGDDVELAARSVLEGVHGLVLSGGADIDPARYGADRDPHTGPPRPDRDAWEIALAQLALELDLPVLGVCRGMEVLTVARGGSLIQHLPDAVGSDAHCPTVGKHGRHDVRLAEGCRLAAILGNQVEVATYHHQAVDRAPQDAEVVGWADDGTIEAIELRDATWALGVQWHPEVYDGNAIFNAFVEACRPRGVG